MYLVFPQNDQARVSMIYKKKGQIWAPGNYPKINMGYFCKFLRRNCRGTPWNFFRMTIFVKPFIVLDIGKLRIDYNYIVYIPIRI